MCTIFRGLILHGSRSVSTVELLRKFGLAVRAERLRRGWSQEQLAAAAGVDRTYVSGLERGVRNPALSTQEKIAAALGTPLADLIGKAESEQ
jgi:transcriptional regulator with XRE-family HTH domain